MIGVPLSEKKRERNETIESILYMYTCTSISTCTCMWPNLWNMAHNNWTNAYLQTLTTLYSVILHRKTMKFGIEEDQLMQLIDTTFSLLTVQHGRTVSAGRYM